MSMRTFHRFITVTFVALLAIARPARAHAQQDAPPVNPEEGLTGEPSTPAPAAQTSAELSLDTESASGPEAEPGEGSEDKSGLFLLGGKIGGIASLNGLDPFVHGAIEIGYVFPALDQGLGAYLQVEYSAPSADGHVDEDFDPERVPSGGYDWKLLQKELVLSPTFLYRMTSVSDWLTPYVGLGLRIYLLEDTVNGSAGDQKIADTTEQSTKWGVGVPLGAEFALGPGGITAELLLQWGPLKHTLTGDTHLGGISLFVGYRLLL